MVRDLVEQDPKGEKRKEKIRRKLKEGKMSTAMKEMLNGALKV